MNLGKMRIITKIISIIAIVTLLASLYLIIFVKRDITIQDGSESLLVKSHARTVGDLLAEKGIALREQDKVEPGLDAVLASNMTVIITRIKPVEISADGKTTVINTTGSCVKEVLKQAGVIVNENDRVIPGLEEPCADRIQVIRVERKEISELKSLAYDIQKVADNNLYKGEQRIRQKGLNGQEKLLYEVVLEDGIEVARKLVEKVLLKKSVNEIVAVGTLQTVSRGENPLNFKQVIQMTATGYTHTGNRTYTDIWPAVGIVAVDPRVIPLGTRLYVDGYGYATAMDIGSAIKGNRIDLFFDTKKEALKWGRRLVQVFILE